MNDGSLVSVIMNCHNGERYLEEAIRSVCRQTYKNWEIVFWDNASTDGTAGIVQAGDYPNFRYFRGTQKVSLGRARNLALAQARGEMVAFLDCDDAWMESKLARQLQELYRNPSANLVYANYIIKNELRGSSTTALRGAQPQGACFEELLKNYPIGMSTVLFRRRALSSLAEPFDESLSLAEELDVFLRIAMNQEIVYIPEPLAVYRIHGAQSTIGMKREWPAEFAHVVTKLRTLDADSRYKDAIDRFEARNHRLHAMICLSRDEMAQARSIIRKHWFRGWKFLAVLVLASLPKWLWRRCKHHVARGMLVG